MKLNDKDRAITDAAYEALKDGSKDVLYPASAYRKIIADLLNIIFTHPDKQHASKEGK